MSEPCDSCAGMWFTIVSGGVGVLGWLDGLTRNWATLEAGSTDPSLQPIAVPLPPAEAVGWPSQVIATLPRWKVIDEDGVRGTLHATHATRLWRFVDDVQLRFEPAGVGTIITARSQSRIGRGDLGQNARNLRELRVALLGHLDERGL